MGTIFDGILHVHHGYWWIAETHGDPGDLQAAFVGQENGLLGGRVPRALWGRTGLHTGPVHMRIDAVGGPPDTVDTWDDVVEVSFEPPRSATLGAFEHFHALPGWPTGPWLRARLHAQAMDEAKLADSLPHDSLPIDSYLVQVWEDHGGPRPDQTLRRSSRVAEYWHATTPPVD